MNNLYIFEPIREEETTAKKIRVVARKPQPKLDPLRYLTSL